MIIWGNDISALTVLEVEYLVFFVSVYYVACK